MGNIISNIRENCCICIASKKINYPKDYLLLNNVINDVEKLNTYELEKLKKILNINNTYDNYHCC